MYFYDGANKCEFQTLNRLSLTHERRVEDKAKGK